MTRPVLSIAAIIACGLLTLGAATARAQEPQLPRCSDDHVVDAVAQVLAKHTPVPDKTADASIGNITEVGETKITRTCNATIKATVSRGGMMQLGGSRDTAIEYTISPSEKHGRFTGFVVSVNVVE